MNDLTFWRAVRLVIYTTDPYLLICLAFVAGVVSVFAFVYLVSWLTRPKCGPRGCFCRKGCEWMVPGFGTGVLVSQFERGKS